MLDDAADLKDGYAGAVQAMEDLLWELPGEFSQPPFEDGYAERTEFKVIKQRNVRKVHEALWKLQQYLGMDE